jgi:hypothetical protein
LSSIPISRAISWISCSDFLPRQIAKEFVGWMKSGPKDIGTATFETLRICEKSMNYWVEGYPSGGNDPNTPLTISQLLKKKRPTGKVINGCNAKIIEKCLRISQGKGNR